MTLPNTIASTIQTDMTSISKKSSTAVRPIFDSCQDCSTKNSCETQYLTDDVPDSKSRLSFRSQKINRGQHIFYAGEKIDTLYLIKSGLFKSYFDSEIGDEKIMGFYMPGEVLGADAITDHSQSVSAVALETSIVCAVPLKSFKAYANRSCSDWLLRLVYQEVLRERQLLLVSGRKFNAEARIAHFLLEISARNHARGYSEQEFKLSMPQRDIARYLDMALETVSRVFTRLQNRGFLSIKRPYVKITNIDNLRHLARE